MSQRTQLAGGIIHGGDRLSVELIHSCYGRPARVAIVWPTHPTQLTPDQFPQAAADAVRILSSAATALASLKARKAL